MSTLQSMKQIAIFNSIFGNRVARTFAKGIVTLLLLTVLGGVMPYGHDLPVYAQQSEGTCNDGLDNDGDGRADWDGVQDKFPPDPACVNANGEEYADDVVSTLIPCTNKCDLGSVFQFINNLISFLIKTVLFPVSILIFVFAGYKYITAQGNPSKKADVKKMVRNLIFGMVLILTSWVIVKTILIVVGYDNTLFFFEE